jgi:hypothetical protein
MVLFLNKALFNNNVFLHHIYICIGSKYNVTYTYICFILVDNYVILNAVEELITYFIWCFGYNLIV